MSVSRTNDRVMSVKLGKGETVVNVICAYAPQVGCEEQNKRSNDECQELNDSLVSVGRTNDRVMSVKLGIGETVVNVICAYTPQVGCEEEERETFWRQMDQELRAIPEGERVIVGGDLSGHVGSCREAIERIHDGWGVGEKNE